MFHFKRTVWVVEEHVDYEGISNYEVFGSRKRAEAHMVELYNDPTTWGHPYLYEKEVK